MPAIDEAIAYIDSLALGENFEYVKVVKMYGVDRITLSRRHRRVQRPRQKLTPQQEQELVRYIKRLTERHIPPTREMIQNFALTIAKELVSES
ncbi:hypothetical protein BU23DRAFT_535025 [Bimuria novae-zelandiae CBS 107.79]|uniref:HTH CENPB-type domain-containing protein n=1 Tax=Bimuria novae-zelandiae CBS 107.79 TaxID=1447943 RepID=A0A6A5V7W4_9PLEO|nr:hypothetical protein BU23DRAFT_535025 [Bimuria novae-zelandiae CBS 107.79]